MDIKYQLVPLSNQKANNADRSIQHFNNHFIEELWSVYKDFHLQLWEIMIQQATTSLNILQQSIIHPHLSSYTHIYGELDYNQTPLSPTGTIVLIHNRTNNRESWSPIGEPGWYIGPSMDHYRCHNTYIPKTRAERISDTVELFPRKLSMPNIPYTDFSIHALQDIIHALQNLESVRPLVALWNAHNEALRLIVFFWQINRPSKTSKGGTAITAPKHHIKAS